MSPQITIDMDSAVPPFEQVRSQMASLITSGTLTLGTRLPTVRDLAADLGLAVGTVARAYRELEQEGLVKSRRRFGTMVAYAGRIGAEPLWTAVEQLVQEARQSGISDEDVLALVQGALLGTPKS